MSDEEVVKRKPIPKALREQVWLKDCGRVFDHKCNVKWCKNNVENHEVVQSAESCENSN